MSLSNLYACDSEDRSCILTSSLSGVHTAVGSEKRSEENIRVKPCRTPHVEIARLLEMHDRRQMDDEEAHQATVCLDR